MPTRDAILIPCDEPATPAPTRRQRQQRRRQGTGQHERAVVHGQSGHDAFPQAPGADEGRHRGRAHVDHRRRLGAGQQHRARQGQLHPPQRLAGVRPSARAARVRPRGTPANPAWVLRTMGSSAYTNSASKAGQKPMAPSKAIKKASSASVGTVCSTPTAPSSHAAQRGRAQAHTPNGTPTPSASSSEPNTSARCYQRQAVGACASAGQPSARCRNSCVRPMPQRAPGSRRQVGERAQRPGARRLLSRTASA
jgi:hypothetical protein